MMNKASLLIAAALSAAAIYAQDGPKGIILTNPVEIPGPFISKISPDGRYALSEDSETLIVYDLLNGGVWFYAGDGESTEYTAGLGQPFSATGILVGCTTVSNSASYWENGEWKPLPKNPEWKGALARGINRDASVICGTANPDVSGPSTEDVVSSVPCIWRRQADGTYGMPELLPYPALDFTGRVPQYVTVLTVSDDGKSILGQVVDYSGFAVAPVLYTCNENGEWSYDYFGADLVNPEHLEFPEWVDENIQPPVAPDYMDAQQRAEYEQAIADWNNGGMAEGEEPLEEDYMTPEKFSEYSRAVQDYDEKITEQATKQMAFFEVFNRVLESGMQFVFNNQYANADGTIFAASRKESRLDTESGEDISYLSPYRFTIASDGKISYKKLGEGYQVTDIADDGTVLMIHEDGMVPPTAFIAPADGEIMAIESYISSRNENLGNWIVSNMTHTLTSLTGQTDTFIITGYPHASADLKIFSCATENFWNFSDYSPYYYSYLFGIDMKVSGIDAASDSETVSVKALHGGCLEISGIADIEIYSADGVLLYTARNATGIVEIGLSGLAVIRTIDAEGNTGTIKTIF